MPVAPPRREGLETARTRMAATTSLVSVPFSQRGPKTLPFDGLPQEMEAAELYTLAARYQRRALAVLTVSDHLITGAALPAEDRERSFADMIEIALIAAFD